MARSMRPVPGCTSSGGLDPIPMTSPSDSLPGTVGHSASVPPHRLAEYSVDGLIPSTVVSPEDVAEVSRVLSQASGEDAKVAPWGGGTQMGLGNPPTGLDLVLDLGRLDGVLFHEPGDLVAGVEAGITLEAFQERLAQRGQILPLEAPYPSRATIGGILAANASGPSRLGHGTARDWLIGIAVVRSDGAATKAGARVVKNVTGYDLNKLYTGSLGTLGVIVGATFKLSPLPPDGRTVVAVYPLPGLRPGLGRRAPATRRHPTGAARGEPRCHGEVTGVERADSGRGRPVGSLQRPHRLRIQAGRQVGRSHGGKGRLTCT